MESGTTAKVKHDGYFLVVICKHTWIETFLIVKQSTNNNLDAVLFNERPLTGAVRPGGLQYCPAGHV